ncbi:MAG: flagellar biosynthesis protein FlhF [Hydrogenophilales bacterium 28-61-23]|nr:MAG: flagellar biosynthesis protein FlhF [Hydrogenophilales bacterium 28-61-23]
MIKKFHAQTTRDALRQVRDALGASALILSNRQVAGGVEIIAVADMDMAALAAQAEPALWRTQPTPARAVQPPAAPVRPAQPVQATAPARPSLTLDEAKPQITALADYLVERDVSTLIRPSPNRQAAHAAKPEPDPVAPAANSAAQAQAQAEAEAAKTGAVDELAREMRLLRGMVEGQLAGFAWHDLTRRDPIRMEAMKRLLAAGFSAAFARMLLERLPDGEADLAQALKWIKSTIAHNLKLASSADDIVERGGVYALVGPTGVGKTTTVAKLAARAVLRHGAAKVALVTTDTYRIGAQDQLRIYGRILGTPVFAVRDENDLEMTLSDLSGRHLVFVDTVGMSQRDKRLAEQVALLCGEQRDVKRLLLLGAPSQGVTLEEVARAYSGPGLIGCILTKIDEALTYGPVLDVAIRHELPVHFVTNGQRVPEDLHLANASYLADRAFRIHQQESPFTQDENDYPILMAAALDSAAMPKGNDAATAMGGLGALG